MGTAALPSSEPSSLQKSVVCLYGSPHLGVFLANEERIVDANDAFLNMIGFTRQEMLADAIDWWALTAPEYRPLDLNAMEQMREYGACVPYEKEYILRDGARLRFMIGAVGLTTEPLTWAAYVVNLSEYGKSLVVEQRSRDLQAAAKLVNRLAHELNNPLAALTFLLHLLSTHPDLTTHHSKQLLISATVQLDRIAVTVAQVLKASLSDHLA